LARVSPCLRCGYGSDEEHALFASTPENKKPASMDSRRAHEFYS
jgi:hypothetical protein